MSPARGATPSPENDDDAVGTRRARPSRPARKEPEPRPRVLDSLEGSAGEEEPAPPAPPAESAELTAAHYTNRTRRIARRIVQSIFFRGLVNRTIRRTDVVDPAAYGVKGTCVVVANHSSHLDAPLVMSGVPRYISRNLATGVAADYFFTAWHKKFFTQLVFNAFPVDRRGEGANKGLSKKLLAAGVPLLIFPEGTRSKTGKMAPFQVGAASLALAVQVPVVPVALIGAHEAMPRGANWPRRGRPPVVVAVGAPLRARGNETARSFNERIEAAVRALYAANRRMIQD
ncbi:hypothetical protein KVA01_05900 [Kocuria varians]|uniref:Phospholipid/glycerol acyltransferase domain-containing protein n=1 Tax=Kocuria varians TaxID=1272 RepID=A0A4Y4CZR5_KOCVA|nr:hypothetical protein KVA01_05900 [Kocuria varians]